MAEEMTHAEKMKAKYDAHYLRRFGMTYHQYNGSKGGKAPKDSFAHGKVDPRVAGSKGGIKSREARRERAKNQS